MSGSRKKKRGLTTMRTNYTDPLKLKHLSKMIMMSGKRSTSLIVRPSHTFRLPPKMFHLTLIMRLSQFIESESLKMERILMQ